MINLLTFDIEEWFHTTALRQYIDEQNWGRLESSVVANVHTLLELLAAHQTRATFFILGWIAERYPGLVQEIDRAGHEIASHGYRHRLIYDMDRETFREYVHRAKGLLEGLTGKPVLGYRATSFSVVPHTLWALDILREAGFIYDSSMFPIKHDIYGINGFPRFPFRLENGLIEVPASTVSLWGKNLPIAGGGYFRLYPYRLTKKGMESLNRAGHPAVVYLHPWELDPDCPRVAGADWRTKFRQYVNLAQTAPKLKKLLTDFRFAPISQYVEQFENEVISFEAGNAKL